jgi:hypothetical protein
VCHVVTIALSPFHVFLSSAVSDSPRLLQRGKTWTLRHRPQINCKLLEEVMAVALGCAIQASLNQGSVLQEYDTDCEVFRQRFRQFQYTEAAGPHEAFNKLWELCCQWLKPKMRSKEQILELLVLEQFLTILPTEIETWVREHCPDNRERVVSLIEDLQRELEIPEPQVRKKNVGSLFLGEQKEVPRLLSLYPTFGF